MCTEASRCASCGQCGLTRRRGSRAISVAHVHRRSAMPTFARLWLLASGEPLRSRHQPVSELRNRSHGARPARERDPRARSSCCTGVEDAVVALEPGASHSPRQQRLCAARGSGQITRDGLLPGAPAPRLPTDFSHRRGARVLHPPGATKCSGPIHGGTEGDVLASVRQAQCSRSAC